MGKKEITDLDILEETNVMFNPATQTIDLNKDEKLRVTALFMAINAYQGLIIKDAEMLRASADLARRDEGPQIKEATMDAMVNAALQFEFFIKGEYSKETNKEETNVSNRNNTESK